MFNEYIKAKNSHWLDDTGVCDLITLECSTIKPCSSNNKTCVDHNHVSIQYPIYDLRPLCYPLNKATYQTCSPSNKTLTTNLLFKQTDLNHKKRDGCFSLVSSLSSSPSDKPYHP
jgi:hypothetical protein